MTLERSYIDGVSLTHGLAGSRQHIWSFATALYYTFSPDFVCPCTDPDSIWPYNTPSYVGDVYFCDAGNPGPESSLMTLILMILCGMVQVVLQLAPAASSILTPPYFCTTLPAFSLSHHLSFK